MGLGHFDPNDPNSLKNLQNFFSPQEVDQQFRQAIRICWMMLPAERKSVDEVEKQARRIFDRIIKDMREDSDAFGPGTPPTSN
jgi:hypothetical protein